MWAAHGSELRADMQRVYGVDLDDVSRGSLSIKQAAALAACLPKGSLCLTAEDAGLAWSDEQLLLLAIINTIRGAVGVPAIDPFADGGHGNNMGAVAMDVDDLDTLLKKKRTEVSGDVIN